jgi:hypothetical protein
VDFDFIADQGTEGDGVHLHRVRPARQRGELIFTPPAVDRGLRPTSCASEHNDDSGEVGRAAGRSIPWMLY